MSYPVYPKTLLPLLLAMPLAAAQIWTVRVEEPTGIERRDGEIVRVPLEKLGGFRQDFRVADAAGREVPTEVRADSLLFPATLMGGAVAEYRVTCCESRPGSLPEQVTARALPSGRIELRNNRLRVLLDRRTGHIVEAYHLGAGPQRVLNLVETTPGERDKNDIHPMTGPLAQGAGSPVAGPNHGWGALAGIGAVQGIDISAGPLSAGAVVRGVEGQYELTLDAGSAALRWTAQRGFRFASVSASPHMPFNRCVDGNEYLWPGGPGEGEPPDNTIGVKSWTRPPGGHFVYYRPDENYGALAIVALDDTLSWTGACTSRFEAKSEMPRTGIAVVFPEWRGVETALAARAEARKLRNPLLVEVAAPVEGTVEFHAALLLATQPEVRRIQQAPRPWSPVSLPLDGEWELAWGEKGAGPTSEWRKVRVPGSAHLQWLPREQIYSREASWVSYKEWWYKRAFDVPADWKGRRVRLQFDATDYYAEAFLDGRRLGRHEGYVDPYEYDVTALVTPGRRHELKVRVWTPVHYYWKHRPYTIKGSYGGVDQKPDDITALGITRSVRLVAGAPVQLADVAVATDIRDGRGLVSIEVEAAGGAGEYVWELTLSPRNFQGGAVLQIASPVTEPRARFEIPVDNPQLWWTWDHGKPNLYTLDVRIKDAQGTVLDARSLAAGIRTITRIGDKFYLNGKPVFLRGTNTYANLWLSEMGRKEYERDLDIIAKMNVNLIRLHCHFENREFYDLADERGLFVWQDFLEAWYPHDTAFSRHAAALFDNHIRHVRNHPSVMAWAPSDEEDMDNYVDLAKHLAARPSLLDPQDRYVQRSTSRWGDAHLYHGWYGDSIWDYAKMDDALVTELGATALPAKESLDKFLKDKWPITQYADAWRYHRLQIEQAGAAWGDLSGSQTPAQLIEKSQNYAARLFQIALERARRNKARGAGGIFHFFAIDLWPSITMAAVDFYRVPTKVHAQVARSFEPVMASFEFDRDEWKAGETLQVGLWAINDRHERYQDAEIAWKVLDNAHKTVQKGRFEHVFDADSSTKVGQIAWKTAAPGAYSLVAEVRAGGRLISENVFEFRVVP